MIKFKNRNGATVTTIDAGWHDTVQLSIEFNGTGTATLTGSIYRNTNKIGELRYDRTNGSNVIWYNGEGSQIPVNNGDEIRAVIESPTVTEYKCRVTRKQAPIKDENSTASIVDRLTEFVPGVRRDGVIRETLKQLNQIQSRVSGSSLAENVYYLRQYMAGELPLPAVQAYAYDTQAKVNEALGRLLPPTPQAIFNSWHRTMADQYFPNGKGSTGDAAAWYWDNAIQAAVQPNNTSPYVTFISEENPENYDLSVTLTSTNSDDDWNTVVLAFVRDTVTGLNHTLDLVVCPSASNDTSVIRNNLRVMRDFGGSGARSRTLVENNFNNISAGWSGKKYRVWATRRGDQFIIYGSGWSTLDKKSESLMTFNLNDHADLAIFKGGRPYGFGSRSQAASSFRDIEYVGGLNRNIVLDIANNRVYRYSSVDSWKVAQGVTIHSIMGAPRVITAVEGGKQYLLNNDGTITAL